MASFVSRESYKQDAPTAQWNMANIPWHYTACSEPHGCNNQEAHHKQHKFKEEYLELLGRFEVDYNPEYLFDWIM
ncbi:MAG: hypothetical protein JXR67_02435 [Bacteroidales bacterium]|nr:hypothetical protein [Bacteroidales bacterium]